MESTCKVFDKLSEVNSLISDVVEDSFIAITLVLHIADFHLQAEPFCYLSALNHRGVFACFRLIIFLNIHRFGYSVDAFDVVSRLEIGFLQL